MPKSFAARLADQEHREALESLSCTERLLALLLLELRGLREPLRAAEAAALLQRAGLSPRQIAALLDTTPASLSVARHRAREA
jgi:hypothetical protein